jgi:hypothetical protein
LAPVTSVNACVPVTTDWPVPTSTLTVPSGCATTCTAVLVASSPIMRSRLSSRSLGGAVPAAAMRALTSAICVAKALI